MSNDALVLGVSRDIAFSAGVLIANLAESSPGVFSKVIIFHDEMLPKDKEIISSFIDTEFLNLPAEINSYEFSDSPYLRYFTPFVLSKLECFLFLDDFDTVTWLDTDVHVRKRLSPLLKQSQNGARFMMGSSLREQLLDDIPSFDTSAPALFTGAFSLSNGFFDGREVYAAAHDFIKAFSRVLYLPDQAAITAAFQQLELAADPLAINLYAPHPTSFNADALMTHSYGPIKFWNSPLSAEWTSVYDGWLALGGSPYRKKNAISHFRELWLKAMIRRHRKKIGHSS